MAFFWGAPGVSQPAEPDDSDRTGPAAEPIARAMALGDAAREDGATQLVTLIEHPNALVRAQAAASLARLGSAAFPAMIAALARLGSAAFPAMIAALNATERPIPTTREFGNNRRPPVGSDYLAFAFISSRDDPGDALIAWARSAPADQAPATSARLRYVSVILGDRGGRSLATAMGLLDGTDLEFRHAGIDIVQRIGPDAATAAPALMRLALRDQPPSLRDRSRWAGAITTALGRMGAEAQDELFELFVRHPSGMVRESAGEHLAPNPAYVTAQLAALSSTSEPASHLALRLLSDQPALPPRAAAPLLRFTANESTVYRAFIALARVEHDAESAARTAQSLSAFIAAAGASQAAPEHVTLAIMALAATGETGLQSLNQLALQPAPGEPLCGAIHSATTYDPFEGAPARPSIQESLRVVDLRLCAPRRGAAEEEGSEWTASAIDAANAGAAVQFLTRGSYAIADMRRVCEQATQAADRVAALRERVARLDWARLSSVADNCGAVVTPEVAAALFDRAVRERQDFERWVARERHGAQDALDGLLRLQGDPAAVQARSAALIALASSPLAPVRRTAIVLLASIAETDVAARAAVATALDDNDAALATTAAEAIAARGNEDPNWPRAINTLLVLGMERDVALFLERSIDDLRPPEIYLTSGRTSSLPQFPWPPPRYASMLMFGRDLDRRLLGRPEETLETIYQRIIRALAAADAGYESGLFGVPGGFLLLTKLEQTDPEGRPLPGRDRWRDVRPPPSSLSDYVVRLFLAPPGYYRTIAFVFTNRMTADQGSGQLPGFGRGGRQLPPDLAAARYDSRGAYILVYAFQRRDTGTAQPYTLLSARQHLDASGLLRRLNPGN